MKGGDISGTRVEESSQTKGWGGGLYLMEGASFTMTGGSIAGNTAGARGGGVYVGNGTSFIVDGGTIYGNTDDTNKNEAKATNEPWGHAIIDNRAEETVAYDENVTKENFPR
jgi:hypothetical protein